jgi:hypothetical protein
MKGKSKKVKGKTCEELGFAEPRTVIAKPGPSFLLSPFSFFLSFCLFTFSFLLVVPSAYAQEPPDDQAPPPLKRLSESERTQLNAQPDIKRRTKLALELMETRIRTSEMLGSQKDFDAMYKELGGFHALMDDTLAFLNKSDKDSDKVLNNFKRVEIGLRKFPPRLEVIRRDLPIKYEYYVRILIRYIRDARAKAVEPLFDDTVVPEKKP